jgi:NADP-dependent 3-hydroxy-3-methylglutaryl-CoA reductase
MGYRAEEVKTRYEGGIPEESQIPYRGHYSKEKWEERLAWARDYVHHPLPYLGDIRVQPEILKGNIENFIGSVEIPVGLAGPLFIKGQHAQGYQFAPFATTEGALVASACRGAKALNLSGGVSTRVLHQQMMRAPVFITASIGNALRLESWVRDHFDEIKAQVGQSSRRAQLLSLDTYPIGRMLYIRFMYSTGDAAGQNMTTVATWKACQWMLRQLEHHPEMEIIKFMVESNMSGDKKVNQMNYLEGRGTRVLAEAWLPDEVLQQVLKVSADELVLGTQAFMSASVNMGMVGFNINISNAIAAIYTATGQDIACVHESSVGQLSIQRTEEGVYASMMLPSLIIGTVGGGTGLPTQQDALKLMGSAGTGKANKLAEIIAGYCLALDLSTLCAIIGGQFASAHEQLGRNRPDDGLKDEHLDIDFFKAALQSEIGDAATIVTTKSIDIDTGNSILSGLTSNKIKKKIGHFAYELEWRNEAEGRSGTTKVVIKAKPTDHEIVNMLNTMAQGCGNRLGSLYELHKFETGFRYCHLRELSVYNLQDERFTAIAPKIYSTWLQDDQEIYVIVMEYLEGLSHLNSVEDISVWKEEHIKATLKGIAKFHSIYLNKTAELGGAEWQHAPTAATIINMMPLWEALLDHNVKEFPELYVAGTVDMLKEIIAAIPSFRVKLDHAPKTLIHCDFNPRNIGLRVTGEGYQLCAYDWELATIHVPQYDVAEFLSFVLPAEAPIEERHGYVEYYRQELERASGEQFDAAEFLRIFQYASMDIAYNRLGLYTMAHTFKEYGFLPRVLKSHFNYVGAIYKELTS